LREIAEKQPRQWFAEFSIWLHFPETLTCHWFYRFQGPQISEKLPETPFCGFWFMTKKKPPFFLAQLV